MDARHLLLLGGGGLLCGCLGSRLGCLSGSCRIESIIGSSYQVNLDQLTRGDLLGSRSLLSGSGGLLGGSSLGRGLLGGGSSGLEIAYREPMMLTINGRYELTLAGAAFLAAGAAVAFLVAVAGAFLVAEAVAGGAFSLFSLLAAVYQ